MWETIKSPFVWIADKWHKFELWVASIAPGVKTHLTALAMFVGDTAFMFKDYLDELPLEVLTKHLTADFVMGMNLMLITLIFWFRRLAKKEV